MVKAVASLKMATMKESAETVVAVMSTAEKMAADVTDRKAAADGILEGTLMCK
jgi:hypothetical protein